MKTLTFIKIFFFLQLYQESNCFASLNLFTYLQQDTAILLTQASNLSSIEGFCSSNRPGQKCKNFLITHGFLSNGNVTWINNMKSNLFELYNLSANIFVIDWSNGSITGYDYEKAINNMETKSVLETYKVLKGISAQISSSNGLIDFHCIGHSLGAHYCGLLSKLFRKSVNALKFRRISALDPAGPCI